MSLSFSKTLGQVLKAMKDATKKMINSLFGGSEFKNKMAMNTAQMIVEDMLTLYKEYKAATGLGVLVFNGTNTLDSSWMTLADLKADVAVAEEFNDDKTASFLKRCVNACESEADNDVGIIMMVTKDALNLHIIDLEKAADALKEIAENAPRIQ